MPETIGRFRIERLIGRGAMGLVYLAHDPTIDRRVAIKLVRADLLETGDRADFLERFRREAQTAARCVHGNIVTVFDFAMHEGNPFIAMEFVDGTSLEQRFPRGVAVERAGALAIVQQILAGLQAAHAQGVVHRDIKPANVLLTPRDAVKITDFGIARMAMSGLTQSGAVIGTLSYMAPEQCRGGEVDHRADLFSTACILHELLLGTRPFPGGSEAEIMGRLLHEAPFFPPVHSLASGLVAVLQRGLAKEPGARFASSDEMAAALQAGAGDGDATVVQMRGDRARPPDRPAWDRAVLSEIELQLASYVGPIARAMVQSAARTAPDLETLRDILARAIDRPEDRGRFLDSSAGIGAQSTSTRPAASPEPGQPAIPPAVLASAQQELARHLGPIASVIVRRTAGKAGTVDEFWDALAGHIDDPASRADFLRRGSDARGRR